MPAVSVIVLVYKVEKYIEQCARALFEQTLDDLEYIFVDDCTPDASMDVLARVLEDYPARRNQVKILHNEVNRGQAYSRRRGVEAATGDYIIHCDSDDWPEREMYARMFAKASAESLDMVICSMRRVYPDYMEPVPGVTKTDDLLGTLLNQEIYHYLLNKLVVREAYNSPLIWPEDNLSEDTALIIQMASKCRTWGFIEDPLYNYRYVRDSISSKIITKEMVEQIRSNVVLAISFLADHGLSRQYRAPIMHLKCWVKYKAFGFSRDYYLHVFPEANLPILFDRSLTLNERMGCLTKLLGIHGISKLFVH